MPSFFSFFLFYKKSTKLTVYKKSRKKYKSEGKKIQLIQASNKGKISESTTGDKAMRASKRQSGSPRLLHVLWMGRRGKRLRNRRV